ncbi:hypothetical protein ACNF42_06580 [Cuniculiplasma sp. SKW3]|uniref:hypothetical protein n=1 Tax=unclassified Cuniculiplasma TaxID=2619706 RepID=UPI003FD040F4
MNAKNFDGLLKSLTGGYTPVKIVRFLVMAFSLIDAAAHLYASPATYPLVTFWLEIEVSAFIVIGIVFLLGLRIWYLPSILFTLFNLIVYLLSGIVALPPISPAALTGHVQFNNYSFGRAFSLGAWLFIIVVGTILLRYDRGSKLNELLKDDAV